MSKQANTIADLPVTSALSPYSRFRVALKSKEVQRQYPNLLERFLDFCRFEGLDVEQKALKFYHFAKSRSQEEVQDLVFRFVLYQNERIGGEEITSGTLRNYVKALLKAILQKKFGNDSRYIIILILYLCLRNFPSHLLRAG